MLSNNSVTNLFLILQNYLKPFQTWRHSSSPNHCKPLSQSECRENKKSCHLLEKKGTHPTRMHVNNTTCNRSNQNAGFLDTIITTCNRSNLNASFPDTHTHSTNQHPATPDTTKPPVTAGRHNAEKHFLLHLSVSHSIHGGCFPACIGADIPLPGRHPPVHAGIHPPSPAATAADGTQPTGMHTFFKFRFQESFPEVLE